MAGADSSATDYWVRVMPGVWLTKLDGDFSYAGPGITSATTTSPDELGLTKRRVVPQIVAGVQIPFLFSFDAGADLFSEDGTATLQRTVTFGDHSYTGGTTVSTTVSLHDYWGEIGVRPLNLDRIGGGHRHRGARGPRRGGYRRSRARVSDRLHKTVVIPALALRAHVRPIGSLTLEARVHAVDAGLDHQHFEYVDASGQADYRPFPILGIFAGYRYMLYDLHLHEIPRAAAPRRTSSSISPVPSLGWCWSSDQVEPGRGGSGGCPAGGAATALPARRAASPRRRARSWARRSPLAGATPRRASRHRRILPPRVAHLP